MRFEIEVTLAGKRFKYAISFDWPDTFREARILDEAFRWMVKTSMHSQQAVYLPGGPGFGLDWHVFALPVITERPPARAIQKLQGIFCVDCSHRTLPKIYEGLLRAAVRRIVDDAANFASCLRGLLVKKPAAYGAFDGYVRQVIPDFSSIDHDDRGKEARQLMVTFKRPDSDESLRVEFDIPLGSAKNASSSVHTLLHPPHPASRSSACGMSLIIIFPFQKSVSSSPVCERWRAVAGNSSRRATSRDDPRILRSKHLRPYT